MVYVQVQFERKLNCSWEIRARKSGGGTVFHGQGGWNVGEREPEKRSERKKWWKKKTEEEERWRVDAKLEGAGEETS